MDYEPSGKELAHFPFLKKANDRIRTLPPVETLLSEERGSRITRNAADRISQSLSSVKKINPEIHVGFLVDEGLGEFYWVINNGRINN
jgi:DNA primase large subunit